MNTSLLPGTLLATITTVILVQTVALSLTPETISQKAKEFVVQINGSDNVPLGNGSGSIVEKKENTYKILTNRHVVKDSVSQSDYTIQTFDGNNHPVTKIERIESADLAIISFESNNSYVVATLGDSDRLKTGQSIYFAGYPASASREYKFHSSRIDGFVQASQIEDGYGFSFVGPIMKGMSGSPILNDQKQIIGIYGKGNGLVGQVGTLYGIPVKTAIRLANLPKSSLRRW